MADEHFPFLALAVDTGKSIPISEHTHRAGPAAASSTQNGSHRLRTASIHTPYNPRIPVIINTVAENMACHAGITRTKS